MTATIEDLRAELEVDFAGACDELADARFRQEQKDTPQSRAAVAECRGRIDTVLDLYLDVWAPDRV
jgi:hypothetical protein